jgi:hypothetical protein
MRVLRANKEQLAELNGYRNGNSMIAFFPDYAGNMVTSTGVVTDPDFELIRDQLLKLEEIDYVEFPNDDKDI